LKSPKNILILSMIILFGVSHKAVADSDPIDITLEQVAKRVGSNNFLVLENATRVYQAKKSVQVARAALLPKLNIWRIAKGILGGLALDPGSIVELGQDVAPFLVPNNWFRLAQNKRLHRAQREAYRALWGNEIMTAKALYLKILLDQDLLTLIDEQANYLDSLAKIARTRALLGSVPQELAQKFEVWRIDLLEDQRVMRLLVEDSLNQFTYGLGFEAKDRISLVNVDLPNLEAVKPLQYGDYVFRVVDSSAERRQYEHLIDVIPFLKSEVGFSILGGSSVSRGVAGGIFDCGVSGFPVGLCHP